MIRAKKYMAPLLYAMAIEEVMRKQDGERHGHVPENPPVLVTSVSPGITKSAHPGRAFAIEEEIQWHAQRQHIPWNPTQSPAVEY